MRETPNINIVDKDDMLGVVLEEIKEMRLEGKQDKKKMMDKLEGIRSEIESMKGEIKKKEEEWEKEKRSMLIRIEELEKKVDGGLLKEEDERVMKLERRIREMENDKGGVSVKEGEDESKKNGMDIRERRERKKNIVIKGVKETENCKEEIKEICKGIGVEVEIEDIRKIKTDREERGEMFIVKLKDEEMKREILIEMQG